MSDNSSAAAVPVPALTTPSDTSALSAKKIKPTSSQQQKVPRHALHAKIPGGQKQRRRPEARTEADVARTHLAFQTRVSVIQPGDVVMLKLPSEIIKVVTVQDKGIVSIGKYGSFPTSQLIGKHFDVTYEIVSKETGASSRIMMPNGGSSAAAMDVDEDEDTETGTDNAKSDGKKAKGKGSKIGLNNRKVLQHDNVLDNILRPMKRARMEELEETEATNDLIDDNPDLPANQQSQLLSPEEIAELRSQGVSAEEIIQKQIERHERFGFKTEFSKEKWRKRKEKKFSSAFTPLAPTVENMLFYYNAKSPASILSLRIDTVSQLLNLASIRPGGRYLLVEETGGVVIGALLERMGGEGKIMQLIDSDSPPAWPVLEQMNFERSTIDRCCSWLNWNEAEEDYVPVEQDDGEVDLSTKNPMKVAQKNRKRLGQIVELNKKREDLHTGVWDGIIIASSLSPPSILERLTPYLAGSATITIYSQYSQVLAQTLQALRERPEYLAPTLTESWMRKYQVLPGRTHPMMSMSGTGGYLLNAIRVIPGEELVFTRKKQNKRSRANTPQENQKRPRTNEQESVVDAEV